jgi:tripartite motif-containing protein 71
MNAKLLLPIMLICNLVALAEPATQPDIRLANLIRGYSDLQSFGNPTGVFLDAKKSEIYLADAGNHQIGIFNLRGINLWTFKHWVTDSRTGQRTLGDPRAVVVTSDGDIIVSDNKADYLDVFDYRGSLIDKIDPADFPEAGLFRGAVLALDKAGNLYIGTNLEKTEIIKLNPDYQLLMRFGQKGEEPQNFQEISGICIDSDNDILVTDAQGTPILKRFDSGGDYLGGFGEHTIEQNDFSFPCGVAMTSGGRIWIVDQLRQVVKCLTASGEFITMIGGMGNEPGDMYYPSAVASDGDSLLIVTEKNGNRYQQFVIR